jgi:hypothetical protein
MQYSMEEVKEFLAEPLSHSEKYTSQMLDDLIGQLYPVDKHEEVRTHLAQLNHGEMLILRVQLAAVYLSADENGEGDISRLIKCVGMANLDYRDLLKWLYVSDASDFNESELFLHALRRYPRRKDNRSATMFEDISQRFYMSKQDDSRLHIRQIPLKTWIFAFIFFLAALGFLLSKNILFAVISLLIARVLLWLVRIRDIIFQRNPNQMIIEERKPAFVTFAVDLNYISHVYLYKDNLGTQIILVPTSGDEIPFSIHSQDVFAWKENIVTAINNFLVKARKDKSESDSM